MGSHKLLAHTYQRLDPIFNLLDCFDPLCQNDVDDAHVEQHREAPKRESAYDQQAIFFG